MKCSYCNQEYPTGTGFTIYKKAGTAANYCGKKCFTNSNKRKTTKWIKKTKKK
ncbi:MAG: 50S ribosomal protein L24e [Candidatus Micrarchaeota archaeon]